MNNIIRLNNKFDIKKTLIDNDEDIIKKIAIALNTLPEYLNEFKIGKDGVVSGVKDVKTIIKNGNEDSILQFINKYEGEFPQVSADQMAVLWVLYSPYFENPMLKEFAITSFMDDIEKLSAQGKINVSLKNYEANINSDFIIDKWLSREKELERTLLKNVKRKDEESENIKDIDKVETTVFEPQKQFVTINIDESKGVKFPLSYIFDNIVLTSVIPYANYNTLYKLYKTFIPNDDWVEDTSEDNITLYMRKLGKIDNKKNFVDEDEVEDGYSKIEISRDREGQLVIETEVPGDGTNIKNIENTIFDVVKLQPGMIKGKTNVDKLSGVFYIPDQRVNLPIFTDMIMNDDVFNSFILVNENTPGGDSTTRKRNIIYLQFTNPLDDTRVFATISPKIMTRVQYEMKDKDPKTFPINQGFVKVKVNKGQNKVAIEQFQNIIAKLFSHYNQNTTKYMKFYRKFIPDFVLYPPIEDISDKLRDIAPEVFLSKYTKSCSKERNPVVISIDDTDEFGDGATNVFPKSEEEGIPRVYACPTEEYPYMGLIDNKLSNKDKFKYLPCCFAQPQKDDKLSSYWKYYQKDIDDEVIETKKNTRILTTKKFATRDIYGVLPLNIQKMFSIIDKDHVYYRKGVNTGKSSFLESVLDGIDYKGFTKIKKNEDREKVLISERKRISESIRPELCKQECYDFSEVDIIKNIEDEGVFLSPELYVRALEKVYNINILLFERNDAVPEGDLILPRQTNGYFREKLKNKDTVMVYNHTGGIWENFNSVELIVRKRVGKNDFEYNFTTVDKAIRMTYNILNSMKTFYQKQNRIKMRDLPDSDKVSKQYIDEYGKVRYVQYLNGIGVFTEPFQPLDIPSFELGTDEIYKRYDLKDVQSLINEWKDAIVIAQHIDPLFGDVDEIIVSYDNIKFIFAVQSDKPYPNIATLPSSVIPRQLESSITKYIFNEKYMRQLYEIISYNFSRYTNGISSNNKGVEMKQITDYVNASVKYGGADVNNGLFKYKLDENPNSITVANNLIRKAVIYNLRSRLFNRPKDVYTYKNKNFMDNYYMTKDDFKTYPNQVIISGVDNFKKQDDIISPVLENDKLNIFSLEPYFIRYNDKNYLAQPSKDRVTAISIIDIWFKERYNPGNDTMVLNSDVMPTFTLLPYINGSFSEKIYVDGVDGFDDNEYLIGVAKGVDGYKYTAMLPL